MVPIRKHERIMREQGEQLARLALERDQAVLKCDLAEQKATFAEQRVVLVEQKMNSLGVENEELRAKLAKDGSDRKADDMAAENEELRAKLAE